MPNDTNTPDQVKRVSRKVKVDRMRLAEVVDELKEKRAIVSKQDRELYIFDSMLQLAMRRQPRTDRCHREDPLSLLEESKEEIYK